MKPSVKGFLLSLTAGLPIALGAAAIRGVFAADSAMAIMSDLCDAAFAAGVLLLCGGALIWVTQKGALDGLSFTLRQTFRRPWTLPKDEKPERYADYQTRMRAKRTLRTAPGMLAGAAWLILSVALLIAYYSL
jgi:hypothetical protein